LPEVADSNSPGVVIVSGLAAAAMLIVATPLATLLLASVTSTVNGNAPLEVGVPLIAPLLASS
jgi:hypothetical protein